ncbi:MAG: hypothetical protein PHI12_08560 [Dehalococcoidales bacterium]|nr:hypothetical protein [Dehalococcoidales bacterium]
MSSKAFLIETDSMTYSDQQRLRTAALAGAVQRAYNQGIAPWDKEDLPLKNDSKFADTPDLSELIDYIARGGWPKNLDAREFQPTLDAGAGAAADFWNTPVLAAVGTEYSCLGAVGVAPAASRTNKIVVWYKIQIITTPLPVNRLLFRRNTATGLLQAEFDLEQVSGGERVDGYFSEPQVWDKTTPYAINAMCMLLTNAACKVVLGNFVVEPAGQTNV